MMFSHRGREILNTRNKNIDMFKRSSVSIIQIVKDPEICVF